MRFYWVHFCFAVANAICLCVLDMLYVAICTCLGISARTNRFYFRCIQCSACSVPKELRQSRTETETPLACVPGLWHCIRKSSISKHSISFTSIPRYGVSIVHDGLYRLYTTKAIAVDTVSDTYRVVGLRNLTTSAWRKTQSPCSGALREDDSCNRTSSLICPARPISPRKKRNRVRSTWASAYQTSGIARDHAVLLKPNQIHSLSPLSAPRDIADGLKACLSKGWRAFVVGHCYGCNIGHPTNNRSLETWNYFSAGREFKRLNEPEE